MRDALSRPSSTTRAVVSAGAIAAAAGLVLIGTQTTAFGRSAAPDCGAEVLTLEAVAAGYDVDDCPEGRREVRIEGRFEAEVPQRDGHVSLSAEEPNGDTTSFKVWVDDHGTVRVHLATSEPKLIADFLPLLDASAMVDGLATVTPA